MYNSDKHSGFFCFFFSFYWHKEIVSQGCLLRERPPPHLEHCFEILKSVGDWWLVYYSSCQPKLSKVTSDFHSQLKTPWKKQFSDSTEYSLWEKDAPLKHFQLTIQEFRNPNQLVLIHSYRRLQHKFPKVLREATLIESMAVRHLNILWISF